MHVSGCEGEDAREGMQAARPISMCGTEKRMLELKSGNSFTDALFPGTWLFMFCGVSQMFSPYLAGAC